MTRPRHAAGMAELVEVADIFLLDQYGVLHDGERPYPGVVECLERLAAAGRKLAVLSNSGKPAEANRKRLERLGLPSRHFSAVITSGEVARHILQDSVDPWVAEQGTRCLLLTRGTERSLLEGLELEPVESAEAADFVLLAGCDLEVGDDMGDYQARLGPALAQNLPLLCVNPDRWRVDPKGLAFSSGSLAAWYEAAGGRVRWLGKPYPEIYAFARRLLGPGRLLAVGDSLEHDIAGAAAAGLETALVRTGVNSAFGDRELDRLLARAEYRPDWLLQAFRW